MKNKLFIFSSVFLFGIIVSYIALGWSEPIGSMPSNYTSPINTSSQTQDVDENKSVIINLDADKVDGYHASDLLAASSGGSDWFTRGNWTLLGSYVKTVGSTTCNPTIDLGIQIPASAKEVAWCLAGGSSGCSVFGVEDISGNVQILGDGAGYARIDMLSTGTETVIYSGNLFYMGEGSIYYCGGDSPHYKLNIYLTLRGNRTIKLNTESYGSHGRIPEGTNVSIKVFYR
ncbi:MAG TPA: hypothetical protein PKU93_02910 [Candidatus Pacearchaeota archaeon]|nr:hypothetical protein [Candidatus Pacearchaeota archaeon]